MDNYEKIRVVGRGAFGTVYLCRRQSDHKLVIIKQIPVQQMTREERQSALNEAKVLSMLEHPNIIEYYENFLEDKALMIVMEYAEGGTLFDYLQQRGNSLLDEDEVLYLITQILLSLQHVHSKQILHRDLKTQNILMNKDRDVVKTGDFGISKILSSKSKAVTVVGTPCYISPELCEGKPYNQKSDIWAVGCILYELLTLKKAFEASTLPALVMKIMRGSVAPVSDRYSIHVRKLLSNVKTEAVIPGAMDQHSEMFLPRFLEGQSAVTIKQVSCGELFTACLTDRGILMTFGSGAHGCLGHGNFQDVSQAKIVESLLGYEISHVACGTSHVMAVSSEDEVFSWGRGDNGRLGIGHLESFSSPQPVPVSGHHQFSAVECGLDCSVLITSRRKLFACGNNRYNKLGLDYHNGVTSSVVQDSSSFCPVVSPPFNNVGICSVGLGTSHSVYLSDSGDCWVLGSNQYGQMGCREDQATPRCPYKLAFPRNCRLTQVSCGDMFTIAVADNGDVFSWGKDTRGRLGRKMERQLPGPHLVPILHEVPFNVTSLSCSHGNSLLAIQPEYDS